MVLLRLSSVASAPHAHADPERTGYAFVRGHKSTLDVLSVYISKVWLVKLWEENILCFPVLDL